MSASPEEADQMKKLIIYLIFSICLFFDAPSWSSTPGQQLRRSVDEVMKLISTSALQDPSRKWERQNRIFKVVENTFDFTEMARRALGNYYEQIDEQERAEFDLAFSILVENTYVKYIERYRGQKIEIVGEKPVGDRYYRIATEVSAGRRFVAINYYLHEVQGQWLVYDVNVDGVSLVNRYRDRFRQAIRTKKFEGLMSMLHEQLKKLNDA